MCVVCSVCMCVYVCVVCVYVCSVYVCVCVCVFMCMCVCMYVFMCVCVCVYVCYLKQHSYHHITNITTPNHHTFQNHTATFFILFSSLFLRAPKNSGHFLASCSSQKNRIRKQTAKNCHSSCSVARVGDS